MKVYIIPKGEKKISKHDVMLSDRLGFEPGTTLISESEYVLCRKSLIDGGYTENALLV